MPNKLLTPKIIARQALANLYESCVMAQLVHRDYESEFAQKVGDTITIRKPAVFEAHEFNRAQGIVVQDAQEDSTDVKLNHFADVSFAVTPEDLTLAVTDFDEQFVTPAMEAIAQKIDRDLLSLRGDVTQRVGHDVAVHGDGEEHKYPNGRYPWSDSRVLIQGGAILTRRAVPATDRRAVVGPSMQAEWTAEKTWRQADKRGNTEGLTEARMGNRVSGFDPYMTQHVSPPLPADYEDGDPFPPETGVLFHRTAFALAIRPLALPKGAHDASIVNYKGFGLRCVYDYDIHQKQDVISIDVLYGCKTLDSSRAVLVEQPAVPVAA